MKIYLSGSQSRFWSAFEPVGDPTGGPAYGERREPVTIMLVASAAVGAMSAISQANAASSQAKSQANAAEYNATVDKQRADVAMQQSNANEDAQRRSSRIALGQQRAGLVESGIGTDGSAADLAGQSSLNAEMDALNIRYQGKLQASGALAQQGLDSYSATAARSNASNIQTAGYFNAGAAALSSYGTYTNNQALLKAANKGTTSAGLSG